MNENDMALRSAPWHTVFYTTEAEFRAIAAAYQIVIPDNVAIGTMRTAVPLREEDAVSILLALCELGDDTVTP